MNVTRLLRGALMGVSLTALAAAASSAATTTTGAAATPPKATSTKKATVTPASESASWTIEPGAVAALRKMSAYVKTLKTMQIKMVTERDEVDDFGQLLTFGGATTYKVKAPDGFVIDVTDGPKIRTYVYDGKSVTMFDPKTKYYARFDAPSTIRATLDSAAEKYGIIVPLDELFHWDDQEAKIEAVKSAHYVGEAMVNGQAADQYAFRGPAVDWQIWIAQGDKPLPLRFVLVGREDPAKPQFEANLYLGYVAGIARPTPSCSRHRRTPSPSPSQAAAEETCTCQTKHRRSR